MTRVIGGIVAGLLLLAGIVAVNRLAPPIERQYAPILTAGKLGEQVDTTLFQIRVDRVQVAGSVSVKDQYGFAGAPQSTAGVWLVVWATASATMENTMLAGAELHTRDGAAYSAVDSLRATLDKAPLVPGIPQYGPLLFELPPDRLEGAALAVTTESHRGLRWLGPGAEIDLGLSDGQVKRLTRDIAASLTVGQVREL